MKLDERTYLVVFPNGEKKKVVGLENVPDDAVYKRRIDSAPVLKKVKRKKERLGSISTILEEESVAFLDTEYVTTQHKDGPPARLASIGFVICSRGFKELERYHSYIRIDEPIHEQFKKLTGITEDDLKEAPEYDLVMKHVTRKLERWGVSRVFVWGPDELVMRRDLEYYRTGITRTLRKSVNRCLSSMENLETIYSEKLNIQGLGIANLKVLCGLSSKVAHNALSDAVDLKDSIQIIDEKKYQKQRLLLMRRYVADREQYYRLRRFHGEWENMSEDLLQKGKAFLKALDQEATVEARALRDDLIAVCTGENPGFPSAEEYFKIVNKRKKAQ